MTVAQIDARLADIALFNTPEWDRLHLMRREVLAQQENRHKHEKPQADTQDGLFEVSS